MVTELIRPVNYNPGISQKLIKLKISSCRCSHLECNKEFSVPRSLCTRHKGTHGTQSDETESYSSLYVPLLPLSVCARLCLHVFTFQGILKSLVNQQEQYKMMAASTFLWTVDVRPSYS